mgnify:CR=1 FL=1
MNTCDTHPLRCVVVPVGADPYVTEIDDADTLGALQRIVGGPIEACGHIFGDEPAVYVNEEGKIDGLRPNRAVCATKEHVVAGFRSPDDPSRPIAEGELLDVVFGPMACIGFDPETGASTSISDDEVDRVMAAFSGWKSWVSGAVEAAKLTCGPGEVLVAGSRKDASGQAESLAVDGRGAFHLAVLDKDTGALTTRPLAETEAGAWCGTGF